MDSDLDQDVAIFWTMLLGLITDAEKRLATHLAQHNLTPPQFFVLRTLSEHGGRCPIGQIAREHHLTSATMTGLIKRLEAMQPPLVAREQSATDRRSVDVVFTPAGEKHFDAIQDNLLAQLRVVLSLLTPEERQEILQKIGQYIQLALQQFPVGNSQPG